MPLLGVRPILWLASPCRQPSLYLPAKSSLGPQQQEHHRAALGGQTRDGTEAPGMTLLLRRIWSHMHLHIPRLDQSSSRASRRSRFPPTPTMPN